MTAVIFFQKPVSSFVEVRCTDANAVVFEVKDSLGLVVTNKLAKIALKDSTFKVIENTWTCEFMSFKKTKEKTVLEEVSTCDPECFKEKIKKQKDESDFMSFFMS